MDGAIQPEMTRAVRRVVARKLELSEREKNDPILVGTMCLLEKDAMVFGEDQRKHLDGSRTAEKAVRDAIELKLAHFDAFHGLSRNQVSFLADQCYRAAGLKAPHFG